MSDNVPGRRMRRHLPTVPVDPYVGPLFPQPLTWPGVATRVGVGALSVGLWASVSAAIGWFITEPGTRWGGLVMAGTLGIVGAAIGLGVMFGIGVAVSEMVRGRP